MKAQGKFDKFLSFSLKHIKLSHFAWLFYAFLRFVGLRFVCTLAKYAVIHPSWRGGHFSKDCRWFLCRNAGSLFRGFRGLTGYQREVLFSHLSSFFALFSYLLRPFYAFSVNARCGCLRFGATFWLFSPTLGGFDLISVSPSPSPTSTPTQCVMPPAVFAECVACSTQKIVVYILRRGVICSWSTSKDPLIHVWFV